MNLITPDIGIIFWQTATFIFVLIVLRKFAWRKILDSIQEREDMIRGSIESAKEAKKQLDMLQEKGSKILEKANIESEQIVKEAILVKDQIIREAKSEASKAQAEVVLKAKASIEKEKRLAILQIKSQMAAMVIGTTEKLLRKKFAQEESSKKYLEHLLSSDEIG